MTSKPPFGIADGKGHANLRTDRITEEELTYAQKINDAFPGSNADYIEDKVVTTADPGGTAELLRKYKNLPLLGANFPPDGWWDRL